LSGCWVGVLDGISGLCAKVAWVEVMLSNGAEDDMMIYMLVGISPVGWVAIASTKVEKRRPRNITVLREVW